VFKKTSKTWKTPYPARFRCRNKACLNVQSGCINWYLIWKIIAAWNLVFSQKTNFLTFFQVSVHTLWAKHGHFLHSPFDVINNLLLVGEPNNDSCYSEVINITVGIQVAKYRKYSWKYYTARKCCLFFFAWMYFNCAWYWAGPSPRFSSRRGQKPGGAKTRSGGHLLKMQYWMYEATGGPNMKWGGTHFKWGDRATPAPRWRCSG